ncbi:MAG: orotate phosphoribosyltransferase-like protein [Thermoplasmatota archaeon]
MKMKGIESLVEKAMKFKEKGLQEKEIATELNLSIDTVTWLLTHDVKEEKPPTDVHVGWRSIGVFGGRIGLLATLFSDIIMEEMTKMDTDFDTVVGIAINGIPIATLVSEELGKELAIYRPPGRDRKRGGGALSSNYAGVDGKKVVIVDDVISTAETMEGTITDLEEEGAEPSLCVVTVNKDSRDEVLGVPLRGLLRAKIIG